MTGSETVKETIRRTVAKIVAEYRPCKVILFGSYANGMPDSDSDVDLLIIKETDARPIDRRLTVARLAADPARSIPFEPLVLTPTEVRSRLAFGDQFIQHIVEEGEVLYEVPGVSVP